MSCLKFALALATVICATGPVRAWDFGVVTQSQIKLFANKTTTDIKTEFELKNMIAVAYDPIKKDIYVSDSNQKVGSIFRIKITEGTADNVVDTIVAKQAALVQGIAFDHFTSILYWTTGDGQTINFVQVPDNATNAPLDGHVLIRFKDEIPQGIAIDTCKRYLYWTNINHLNATIERSRLDGSDRQVIVHENLFQPLGIAVDMERNLLYWSNEREGTYFSIESSDLNGGARQMLVHGMHQTPFAIALDGRNIYWSDWIYNAVWSLPKNSSQGDVSPTIAAKFNWINPPMGLFTLSSNMTLANDSQCEMDQISYAAGLAGSTMMVSYDVLQNICNKHGVLHANGSCTCLPGFAGEYCQTSTCDGYCVTGTCTTDGDGRPTCKCPTTSFGDRCDRELCTPRCLNGGQCGLDGSGKPRCECPAGYAGDACEFRASALNELCLVYCQHASAAAKSQQSSVCRCDQYDSRLFDYPQLAMLNHSSSPCKVSRSLIAVIIVLTVFVASLGTITMVLVRKVRMLGRRPRIKKRIVVNKSITPLTNRPPQQQNQQCEITIENCCNMNICETPCFEPDFRSPKMVEGGLKSLMMSKSKKQDKENLLGSSDASSEDEKPLY